MKLRPRMSDTPDLGKRKVPCKQETGGLRYTRHESNSFGQVTSLPSPLTFLFADFKVTCCLFSYVVNGRATGERRESDGRGTGEGRERDGRGAGERRG
jgi:hypothetical protein